MSVAERLREAVTPIVPELAEDEYTGEASTYCTFSISEEPAAFWDDNPNAVRCSIQLLLYIPFNANPNPIKQALWDALVGADFTAPTVEPLGADAIAGKCFSFEFEFMDWSVSRQKEGGDHES